MWRLLHKNNKSPFRIIIFGFLLVIFMGSFLLMLPVSTKTGECAPFLDALFTSTSAVCVTGLVIHDTATYWSNFGQSVIILLIQIGGLGVITVAGAFAILSGRKIGLMQRSTMQEAIAAPNVGGIVRRTGFILKTALAVELFGAVLLFPVFFREFGLLKGAWYSLFHSISAFCNAGFDLMGVKAPFSSLTDYAGNPVISIVIALLIAIGGIGFLTWEDIRTNGLHFQKYRMQSKVILTVTGALILIPTIYFFLFEFTQAPMGERVLLSFFQAVTPRTAGFNTADLTALSETGQFVIIILMLIGGSPGSTAGGMKTTTFAVLLANTLAVFRRREHPSFFDRRLSNEVVSQASTILIMYLVLFLTAGLVISRVENLPVLTCLFETASAIGTVGLSLGITPQLSSISHLLLIALMFFGRVGGLTLIFAALSHVQGNSARLPQERITVG
ncbi:TrkH family potassium uptake protein [Flintibacter porci]|uniref:TrkH family potassium uptake protein n=1 Tax=Flintibacter porci TaxID=3342383 RepID=UPI003F894922